MKKASILSFLILIVEILIAQILPFNAQLKPFYHGVASGDPMEDRVIIWTRITPDRDTTITGTYVLATDIALKNMIKIGTFSTDSSKDYTVKMDVTDLQSNTTYYYAFIALGKRSSIGRTKTTPSKYSDTPSILGNNLSEVLKFAVVSCANYEGGYFNAYARIAERNDLNAVIHLGDYYYDYSMGSHRNSKLKDLTRNYIPIQKTVTKTDYRLRLSLYHLDKNLQKLHQQHPFITIWDDHEIANNAYETGAKSNKGDWNVRKKEAKEAYFEWMPIRGTAENFTFYRAFSYGALLDLFMLDTRLEGRQKQPSNFDSPEDSTNPRRMISQTQENWLTNSLKNSQARWKIVGSQVIFSNINIAFAAPFPKSRFTTRFLKNLFLDSWNGYLTQRNNILDALEKNKVNNVVIISGDSHASWSFDLNREPVRYTYPNAQTTYLPQPNPFDPATGKGYNFKTGEGAQGVEFSTPSISSSSFADILPSSLIARWQNRVNKPHPRIKGNPNYNPHLKFVDFKRHGYFILDVRADSLQCDYFYVPTISTETNLESWGKGLSSHYDSNKITMAETLKPALPKDAQDIPAPLAQVVSSINVVAESIIFTLSPNPTSGIINIQYGLTQNADIDISLLSLEEKTVQIIAQIKNQQAGTYALNNIDVSLLSRGIYFLQIKTSNGVVMQKLVIN
jgi:alkaline phosphatase D